MFPSSPFRITPSNIAELTEVGLVALLNHLLWDEGRRLNLPPNALKLSLRIQEPDGGADAITDPLGKTAPHLGDGLMVWQFKQTQRWLTEKQLIEELNKPVVQAAFSNGAGY